MHGIKMGSHKRIIILLTLLVSTVWSVDTYPEWFLFPKKYPALTVGYTYNGMPPIFDAENMYCAYEKCIVVGTLEIFNDPSSDKLLKNSNYFYYFDPDAVEAIHGRLQFVDGFSTNILKAEEIKAFSRQELDRSEIPWLKVRELPRPSWVDTTFMEDASYYYGVGMYTSIGLENDAWKTAEEQAIFNILNSLAVEIHKIEIVSSNEYAQRAQFEGVMFIKLKFLIKNIKILERFPDPQQQIYYVLVRIPKSGIRSKMVR